MEYSPYRWQEECLKSWVSHGCKGIANVVTGAGKTKTALMAISYLRDNLIVPVNTIIVVPTCALMEQWVRELKTAFGNERSISRVGNGFSGDAEAEFQVMVVNTARTVLTRRRDELFAENHAVFLVCDECHHYGSVENRKIFNGVSLKTPDYYTLGLSATPYCEWFDGVIRPALGNVIYEYDHDTAIKDGIISPFVLEQVAVNFNGEEAEKYAQISFDISLKLSKLLKHNKNLKELSETEFISTLHKMSDAGNKLAESLLSLLLQRKELVIFADSRMQCALEIIDKLHDESRIIVFCERISQADTIYGLLEEKYHYCISKYHSERLASQNQSDIRRFKSGETRIMVTCKGLDEGIDVPEADVAIILSGTSVERQHIQRLGRIIRRTIDENKVGVLYYLWCGCQK